MSNCGFTKYNRTMRRLDINYDTDSLIPTYSVSYRFIKTIIITSNVLSSSYHNVVGGGNRLTGVKSHNSL